MAASHDLSQYGTTTIWTLRLTVNEPPITMVMLAAAGAAAGPVQGGGTRH